MKELSSTNIPHVGLHWCYSAQSIFRTGHISQIVFKKYWGYKNSQISNPPQILLRRINCKSWSLCWNSNSMHGASVTWTASTLPCDSNTCSHARKARLHTAGMLQKKKIPLLWVCSTVWVIALTKPWAPPLRNSATDEAANQQDRYLTRRCRFSE